MRDPGRFSSLSGLLALFLGACVGPALRAQEPSVPEANGNLVLIASYPASGFTMESSSAVWSYDSAWYRFSTTSSNPCFVAPVQLPSGVRIRAVAIEGCDTSPGHDVMAFLSSCPIGLSCSQVTFAESSGQPGCHNFGGGPTVDVTVDNENSSYLLRVCNFSGDDTTTFRTVKLLYQAQLSPAPATATFADVPTTHLYFRAIEALAASGITSGCGGGNFCPSQAVTRGEIAKFLTVALGLSWSP
jgi:hypothetical protein